MVVRVRWNKVVRVNFYSRNQSNTAHLNKSAAETSKGEGEGKFWNIRISLVFLRSVEKKVLYHL